MLKKLKTPVKKLKKLVSLLHSVKTWKVFSVRSQNGHLFRTLWLKAEIKLFVAMAPCRILHWRSPVQFLTGGLYRDVHWGRCPFSLSRLQRGFFFCGWFLRSPYKLFFHSCCWGWPCHSPSGGGHSSLWGQGSGRSRGSCPWDRAQLKSKQDWKTPW